MTFKALEPETREILNLSLAKFSNKNNANVAEEMITGLALDFGVPAKAMLELCLVEILFAFDQKDKDLTVETLYDHHFNEGKEKIRAFALSINGRKTKLYLDIEMYMIMNKDDLTKFGKALTDIQKIFHNSDVTDVIFKRDSREKDKADA